MSEEEIIETLQRLTGYCKRKRKECEEDGFCSDCYVSIEDMEAMGGILELYNKQKELLKQTQLDCANLEINNGKLTAELQQEKEKNKEQSDVINKSMAISDVKRDYISKDKIREKIEEIEKAYEDSKDENGESQYWYPNYAIDILQELLEE